MLQLKLVRFFSGLGPHRDADERPIDAQGVDAGVSVFVKTNAALAVVR